MIENILVAIGDTPYEKNALHYAGQLASLLDAHLSCIFFQDSKWVGPEDIANRVLEDAKAECAQQGLLDCNFDIVIGNPTKMVCQEAHSVDLVVIGIAESIKTDGLRMVHDHIDDILLHITKPTIVVHKQCKLLSRILAVHHGDSYSDDVLELASELGERTKASLLGLAIAETRLEADQIAQQMKGYLQSRDVKAEYMTELGFTVTNILETALAQDCDLIALSASHHGRLYEVIFQDTTETVVKLATRAVMVTR
jgi:nucleotide-binding universal stress UspA family protein